MALSFIQPMLLKAAQTLPRGDQWRYELKFDSFRGLAVKQGSDVRLFSRNRKDLTKRFARIAEAVQKLRAKDAVLDGEIVCLDEIGRPCFEDLQNCAPASEIFLFFYAFDLLALNGATLVAMPIEERKAKLKKLIGLGDGVLRISDFIDTHPDTLVEFARQQRLEGVVAKRTRSVDEV